MRVTGDKNKDSSINYLVQCSYGGRTIFLLAWPPFVWYNWQSFQLVWYTRVVYQLQEHNRHQSYVNSRRERDDNYKIMKANKSVIHHLSSEIPHQLILQVDLVSMTDSGVMIGVATWLDSDELDEGAEFSFNLMRLLRWWSFEWIDSPNEPESLSCVESEVDAT